MQLIDTHAHLYVDQFNSDRTEMIQRALDTGVYKMFLPNIDMTSMDSMHELCEMYPKQLFPMMGLHPCSVDKNYETLLDEMEVLFQERDYAGIGETGIDLYWDKSTLDLQKSSFDRQIAWAKEMQLPIVIHSRAALHVTIEMIQEAQDGRLSGVFHCFDGTVEQARKIMDIGFYLGIGGVVTYKKSILPGVLKEIGLDRVVLETDAPYLSPVPKRGKRNESANLSYIVEFIASVMDMSINEVASVTTQNAKQLFEGRTGDNAKF